MSQDNSSYNQDQKKSGEIKTKEDYIQEGMQKYREETKIILNKNNSMIILNAHLNGKSPDEISQFMLIPKEIVTLVINISNLANSYLQYCNEKNEFPDYETFSSEAKNVFTGLTQETIDLLLGS